ncbi:hypothetical protein Tco_1244591 [Tanacetum coccineum]
MKNPDFLPSAKPTILGLSLAAFEKPTSLLNKRISRFENFGLVLVFVWLVFIFDLHYLASKLLGDHGTRGRKKVVGEPTPPARDPHDVETIERLQQRIQKLELQQLRPNSPAKEAKAEPNVWDDESVDVNPFGGEKPRYFNRLYQPRRNDHVVDRDDRYHDDPIRDLGLKIKIPEFTG